MGSASLIIDLFELILTGLVVFASIVWLIFPFIVMSKIRGIREEMEKGNQLLAKISSGSTHSAPHFSRPKVVPPPKTVPIPKVVPIAGVIEPPSVVPLKISRRGQEFGLKDTAAIKAMLKRGELTLQDHYFDKESNIWVTLDRHPEFR